MDELCCGRQTNVPVAWLQRNEFRGGRGAAVHWENVKICSCAVRESVEAPTEITKVELIESYSYKLSADSGRQW